MMTEKGVDEYSYKGNWRKRRLLNFMAQGKLCTTEKEHCLHSFDLRFLKLRHQMRLDMLMNVFYLPRWNSDRLTEMSMARQVKFVASYCCVNKHDKPSGNQSQLVSSFFQLQSGMKTESSV